MACGVRIYATPTVNYNRYRRRVRTVLLDNYWILYANGFIIKYNEPPINGMKCGVVQLAGLDKTLLNSAIWHCCRHRHGVYLSTFGYDGSGTL